MSDPKKQLSWAEMEGNPVLFFKSANKKPLADVVRSPAGVFVTDEKGKTRFITPFQEVSQK